MGYTRRDRIITFITKKNTKIVDKLGLKDFLQNLLMNILKI